MTESRKFTQTELEAIASALGDTNNGLTGIEITTLLESSRLPDPAPTITKRHRISNSFTEYQNDKQDRRAILAFIRKAMKPERFIQCPKRFESMRANLNLSLSFVGLAVEETGTLISIEKAQTLGEAQRRAQELRVGLNSRNIHQDVLSFCREELLVDNYFHAVLEAVKSVSNKIRARTGLTEDGVALFDKALSGEQPLLAINKLSNDNEKSEQKGFLNLVKGTFGMFRNTTAHAPKTTWVMSKEDAEDLLSLVSLIHRRLDASQVRT
ncbi:TIGR02391 family protein [Candidatus Cyanaurora vandensis]|uniref:TIGR02391 family protein n=1 Tax=Candidatus Cyanaurora vandensis TaxID=2714958 RepID=UPI00257B5E66|nr:TIGR02391 family protein [Candidatus Cyanaurora vandensis]